MQLKSLLVCALTVVAACACGGPSTPQGKVVRDGFEAIKAGDWDAYRELTVTFATLEARRQGLSAIKQAGSFLGVVAQEQRRELRDQFEGLTRMGLFAGADFVEVSRDVRRDSMPTASGDSIPYEEYGIVIEKNGRKLDTRDEGVTFVVVEHGTLHRIAGLRIPVLLAPVNDAK
jgi:hypothetical protein